MNENLRHIIEAPVLWSEKLRQAVHSTRPSRQAMIEGLLYERSILMLASDPGVGKSVLALQMALQMSVGEKVFGQLFCPKPRRTLLIQGERDVDETLERIKHMEQDIKPDYGFLYVDTALQGINLMREDQQDMAIARIDYVTGGVVDCIILDPIYSMVAGGLSKDEPATMFCRFSTKLRHKYGCANILIHHTNRGSRSQEDGSRIGVDFYGSQWLQAHVTGAYQITSEAEGSGCLLSCKKDSHSNLLSKIQLVYNAGNQISYLSLDGSKVTTADRMLVYFRNMAQSQKQFSFSDIKKHLGVSDSNIRENLNNEFIIKGLKVFKSNRGKNLYEWIEPNPT